MIVIKQKKRGLMPALFFVMDIIIDFFTYAMNPRLSFPLRGRGIMVLVQSFVQK